MIFALKALAIVAPLVSLGIGIGWAAARYSIGKRKAPVRPNGAFWATSPVINHPPLDHARMSFEDECG